MTITFAPPHLVAPLNKEAVDMAGNLASALTTIVGWGQYVDDEFGMTDDERALWRLLAITRDTLAELPALSTRTARRAVGGPMALPPGPMSMHARWRNI